MQLVPWQDLFIGLASPVRLDSSTCDVPSTITPSAGILSPVLTLTRQPGGRSSAETIDISPVVGSMTFAHVPVEV